MKNLTNQSLLAETDASLIRAELERLLSDRRFSGARQMSAFLRYIVSETLDGNGNRIKAYTVGVDALGKADDFDAQSDPSVRVLALRLRKSLEAAYEGEPECHARIVMTVGSYVPEFYKPHTFESESETEEVAAPAEERAVAGSARNMAEGNAGESVRKDLSNESHSANRHLRDSQERGRMPKFAVRNQRHPRETGVDRAYGAPSSAVSERMTSMLREKWLLSVVVVLLAIAWQSSVNTTNAATDASVRHVFHAEASCCKTESTDSLLSRKHATE